MGGTQVALPSCNKYSSYPHPTFCYTVVKVLSLNSDPGVGSWKRKELEYMYFMNFERLREQGIRRVDF